MSVIKFPRPFLRQVAPRRTRRRLANLFLRNNPKLWVDVELITRTAAIAIYMSHNALISTFFVYIICQKFSLQYGCKNRDYFLKNNFWAQYYFYDKFKQGFTWLTSKILCLDLFKRNLQLMSEGLNMNNPQ